MKRLFGSFLAWVLWLIAVQPAAGQVLAALDTVKPVSASVSGAYWFPRLDASIRVSESGVSGTTIDATGILGIKNDNFFEIRGEVTLFGIQHVIFRYLPIRYSGDRVISENVTFAGNTYAAGSRVISSLDADYYRLGYRLDLIHLPIVTLGLQLDANYVDGRAELAAPAPLSVNESKIGRIGFPTVGIAGKVRPLPFLSGEAEVSGMSAGRYGHFIDAEAAIVFAPVRLVSITGGYRLFDLAAKNSASEGDLRLHGPFVRATIRF